MRLPEFLVRQADETEESYLWRLGEAREFGMIDLSWDEIAEIMNKEFHEDDERTSTTYRKPYQSARKFIDAGILQTASLSDRCHDETIALRKERSKVQSEKIDLNKRIREEARDEMIAQMITEAIHSLPDLPKANVQAIAPLQTKREYLLAFGDCHYGIEFDLFDFLGNPINSYSPEIFESRMNDLLSQVAEIVRSEDINVLNVFEMGDGIQGIIRLNSQLQKLKFGIIESTIRYADYLANWLNALSEITYVKFQMVEDSNHNQLRICGATKNAFSEENMSKVILHFLQERLKDNPNVEIITNRTGMNYAVLAGSAILGIHGEVKSPEQSINEYARAYNTKIDYLIGGHCHHRKQKETGINSEALNVGSIIGVDPYGLSLNKTSNPSASLFMFEEGKGKTREYTIKL